MSQQLKEMEDGEFLAKVDALMECLKRQVGDDSVGGWAVSAIGAEIRRRVFEWRVVATEPSTVSVRVEKLNFSDMTLAHPYASDFHGTPNRVTVTNGSEAVSHGFFSESEADAFLLGLETARKFGLPFTYIPSACGDAV